LGASSSDDALPNSRVWHGPAVSETQTAKTKPSPISTVLDLAAGEPGKQERLLDLFRCFRVPASGLAVPHWARNMACSAHCINFDRPDLTGLIKDLDWLASSAEVATLCATPRARNGNPAVGHCATSAPYFAASCQNHAGPEDADQYAKLRGMLVRLLMGKPVTEAERAAYEDCIRLGTPLPPLSESACVASRAIRYLASSDPAPLAILKQLKLDLPPAQFIDSLASVEVPEQPEALSRFRALHAHLALLLESAPRLKSSRATHPSPSNGKGHSGGRTHGIRDNSDKTGVRVSRLNPKVDPKTARACSEADASPDEITVDDELFVAEPSNPDEDPVRFELLTRAQLGAINKPIHTMTWHVRVLSDHEIAPLLRAAFRVAVDRRAGLVVDLRFMTACCLLLVVLFISRSLDEAADVVLYGPGTAKPVAEVAIYMAFDSSEDRIRLETVKPDYSTEEDGTVTNVCHPTGYIWLPLPSLLGYVLRALVVGTGQSLVLGQPRKLCTLTEAQSESVSDALAKLDPSGRLNLSRLRSTLPSRIWERTSGDLMLSSLLLARKHHALSSEFHYDGEQLLRLANLYREVTES